MINGWLGEQPKGARVLVCGGRTFSDADRLSNIMAYLHLTYFPGGIGCVIHGACHTPVNADKLAGEWAKQNNIPVEEYPVDHDLDGPWPGAGPRRNSRMLAHSHPDFGLVFPGGKGTANMQSAMEKAGIRVWKVC